MLAQPTVDLRQRSRLEAGLAVTMSDNLVYDGPGSRPSRNIGMHWSGSEDRLIWLVRVLPALAFSIIEGVIYYDRSRDQYYRTLAEYEPELVCTHAVARFTRLGLVRDGRFAVRAVGREMQ